MWCIGEHLNIFIASYKNFHSKIQLHVKNKFGKKNVQSFSKVIPLVPNYRLWPFIRILILKKEGKGEYSN
jgi:hypothetical protein